VSTARQALATEPGVALGGPRWPLGAGSGSRAERRWALAFALPYAAVFAAFAIYPILYALWMGARPALFVELFDDPIYLTALVNTLLFVGIGVNLQMFGAILLSGFFAQRRWWMKPLLFFYLLPWAMPAIQAFISFHWMFIGELGFVNSVLYELFGIQGPQWFNHRWLAFGCDIAAYVWKWMPFWTLVFLVGRGTIPEAVRDAARIDGAAGWRQFVHVTFPMLANLYLLCTLISAIWTVGDFNTVFFVSASAPTMRTEVLATLGFRYTLDSLKPELGVAAILSLMPLTIPLILLLIRRLELKEIER
jgi:multiple sugar transport system permease protein